MRAAGWTMTGLLLLFILGASATPKFLGLDAAFDALAALGWPDRYLLTIGVLELVFIALYLFPRTALLGAVLMTGLLGGAIASHLRVGSPMLSHTLFGLYLGAVMWIALWLRDPAFRAYFARTLSGRTAA